MGFPHAKTRCKTGRAKCQELGLVLSSSDPIQRFRGCFPPTLMGDSRKWAQDPWGDSAGCRNGFTAWKNAVPKEFFYYSQSGMGYKLNFQALRVRLGTHEVFPTSQTRLKTGRCSPNPKGLRLILVSLSKSKDSRIIFPHADGCL